MQLQRKIYVTQTFLPSREKLNSYIDSIYQSHQLTNNGPLQQELQKKLGEFLGTEYINCVGNGTMALILALRALDITEAEVITTPFSYVATATSILWEYCTPVFADIKEGFTINPDEIKKLITPRTKAILPVHVYGYACDVETIEQIANEHNLKVIYDAAHAFGVKYKGKSLLNYGDISICSFHATKLFHTAEGGMCVARNAETNTKIDLLRRFGHNVDNHMVAGINSKMSELHSAMGLANFDHIQEIFAARKKVYEHYNSRLNGSVKTPYQQDGLEPNYSYYPVLFKDEAQLMRVFAALEKEGVYPRRYFYPSINTIPYIKSQHACPVSEDIALRVACLPLFYGLEAYEIDFICDTIIKNL